MFAADRIIDSYSSELEKVEAIQRRWRSADIIQSVWLLAVSWLLVASFVFGFELGPASLRMMELVILSLVTLILVFVIRGPLARRCRERAAQNGWRLREGASSRRILAFDSYLLVDDEIILRSSVERVRREGDQLIIRYQDPAVDGPMLRELTGSARVMDAVADAFRPKDT